MNLENSIGMTIDDVDFFLVAHDELIYMFDDITYQIVDKIDLDLAESDTREDIEIINMKADKDGNYIGVSCGKNMINGDEVIIQVIILKRNKTTNRFKVYLRIDMVELEL